MVAATSRPMLVPPLYSVHRTIADEPLPAYLKLAPSHCGSSVQSRAQIRRFSSAVACAVLQTLVDDSLQEPSTSMVTSEPIRWFDVL